MGKHSYEIDWTQPETTRQGINYLDVNYVSQGWQCPICKRVLAPFVPECPCGGQGMKTWTTTSTEGTGKTITMKYPEDFNKQEHNCYYSDKEKDKINTTVSEDVYKKLNKVSKHMKEDK